MILRSYIGHQFAVVAIIAQIVILLFFSYFGVQTLRSALLNQAEENAQNLTTLLSASIAEHLARKDYANIKNLLSLEIERGAIAYALIEDSGGRVIIESNINIDTDYLNTHEALSEALHNGEDYFRSKSEITLLGVNYGTIYFGVPVKYFREVKEGLITHYISIGIVVLLTSALVFIAIGTLFKKRLAYIADEIEKGRMKVQKDEFAHLGETFNTLVSKYKSSQRELIAHKNHLEMLVRERTRELEESMQTIQEINDNLEERVKDETEKRLKQQELLIQQSKMASMGEMIAIISHQWKQPLNVILISAGSTLDLAENGKLSVDQAREDYATIEESIRYLNSTISDFRNFFKPDKKRTYFSAQECQNGAIRLLKHRLKTNNIKLNTKIEDIEIYGVKNELEQVVINIINNAIDALIESGQETRDIWLNTFTQEDRVIIDISDNAGGIPQNIEQNLFKPYFSTKGDKGTGIGLYMSKLIIEESFCGKIRVENRNGGALFTIEIPKGGKRA